MFQNVLRKEVHWWILCRFRADKTHFPRINIMLSFVIRDFQLRIHSYASWKQGEKDDVSSENK